MREETEMLPQKKQTQSEIKAAEELKKLAEELDKPKVDLTELIKESRRRVQDFFEKREDVTTRVRKVF